MAETTSFPSNMQDVLVVIGVGGMGAAIARRIGSGRLVVLADYSEHALDTVSTSLNGDGFKTQSFHVDVSQPDSVAELAQKSAKLGARIAAVVLTAGVSPVTGSVDQILKIDLLGTANVIQAFAEVATPAMSMVCIASMAGHRPFPPELEAHLATAPVHQLLEHEAVRTTKEATTAYAMSKRGNIVRVQAAARAFGLKGAMINSISPGIISTPMGQAEFKGPHGDYMRSLVEGSAARRYGTPEEIASTAEFLVSSESAFITGTDILVDGGVICSKWGQVLGQ